MPFSEVLDRFVAEAPFCVMARALLENAFAPAKMDALFDEHAQTQTTRDLLFSSACEIMSWVVCRIRKTVNASCKHLKKHDRLPVTVDAVYDKLARIETQTSRALVRHTASEVRAVLAHLGPEPAHLLKGYDVRIVDGNHPEGTQHRIGVLRDTGGGALPGVVVAVLDPQARLIEDVVLSADAYAQECTLFDSLLEEIRERQLWIADRHYCTSAILFGIFRRKACFLIRQHAGHLRWELVGQRRRVARTASGAVYEQQVTLTDPDSGEQMTARRVTIELDQATRDGETQIHLLSNVPTDATALVLAELYLARWRLETAFQTLTVSLNCEPNTLGYPPAALFAFCVAVGCYNLLGAMQGAVRAAHGEGEEAKLSSHVVADELSMTYRGMDIAVPRQDWEAFRSADAQGLASLLKEIAARVVMKHYHKYPSRPRKTPRKPRPKSPRKHSSTHRLLNPHLYKDKDDT